MLAYRLSVSVTALLAKATAWSVFLKQDGAEAGHGRVDLERDWLPRVEVVERYFG